MSHTENYYRRDPVRLPPLKKEDEFTLFTAYRKKRTQALREKIVKQYLYWAAEIATRYSGPRFSRQDAISAANVGLMYAIGSFDPAQGRRFVTYSFFTIRRHVIAALHGTSVVSPVGAIDAVEYKYREGTKAPASPELKRDKLRVIDNCAKTVPIGPGGLDPEAGFARGSNGYNPVAVLPEKPRPGDWEFDSTLDFVRDKLHELPRLERRIIELRYLSGTAEPMIFSEIGRRLKISEDHARYLHSFALENIKELTKGES